MHKKYATLASCQLNQWAMSFKHNRDNIIKSINLSKELGASYRLGPELEICGYSCEDHFFERDTVLHSWQMLSDILSDPELTKDILCDIGMPVEHKGALYNCRIFCLNQKIVLIRPKMYLAGGNNYRESRWFTAWPGQPTRGLVDFQLPDMIKTATGQSHTKFGIAVVKCNDTEIASEICEEVWVPRNPHVDFALDGVEIISNASGSHHELRKLNIRLDLVKNATARNGGVYMYSNFAGGDGARICFDGSSFISMNGEIYSQADQLSIKQVEVAKAVIDLDQVRQYRMASHSRKQQVGEVTELPRVYADINIERNIDSVGQVSLPTEAKILDPMQEIAQGPPLWMWDYLRRSGARGFFLPLSGGSDSAVVAALVASMASMIFESIKAGNTETLSELRKVVRNPNFQPAKYQDIVGQLLVTSYLGTKNSGEETLSRSKRVAEGIGAQHFNIGIDEAYDSIVNLFKKATGKEPKYELRGGTYTEDLALQNIQARIRMVVCYLLAQLVPWTKDQNGFLLVLGTSNIAEGLRGYMTKYDCSSADLNPIGGINKTDLRAFLVYFSKQIDLPVFEEVALAVPSAELRPQEEGSQDIQVDEDEMGMSYAELDEYGKLRKLTRAGPLSMFELLLIKWRDVIDPKTGLSLTPRQIGQKVKHFFKYYSINRHKMTVLTPSYHCEAYGNDDNRFDLRQFLYDTKWELQFSEIDKIVEIMEKKHMGKL